MSVQQETGFPPLQVSEKQDRRFSSGNLRVNGQSEKLVLLQPITLPRGSALMKQLRVVGTSGCLSTWPAHVTSQILQQRQKDLSLGLNHSFAKEVGGVRGKPRFLQMLERYLRLELQTLNPHHPKVQESRLQVYREVFDCFIEDLKTYKPLLSAIKNEYEVTLAHLQDQIRELEPLRAQLVIVSERCEQRVLALREEERSEVNALKQEAQCLQKIIDEMREQQDILQTQVRVLQRDLADQYLAYRQEHEARRLLIAGTGNAGHRPGEVQVKREYDPAEMKQELTVCRQDLTRVRAEMERLRAEYADMVPHRDWQALHCAHQESQLRLQTLHTDFDQLRAEYDTLLEVHGQVSPQRGHLRREPKMLQDAVVPPPHREEGTDLLLENQSSQQLKGILLEKQGQRTANPDREEIFTDLVDESVYHRQSSIFSHLLKEFVNIDTTKSGTLTIREFSESLQRALPLIGEDDLKELVKAAQSEMDDSEDVISYQTLCAEHSDRLQTGFLRVLMKQADTQR
ncbi:translin-associated factor X-interacting protein 1 isoform X3 [Brienomyrus brachyistius]|uniref:translin-associated factor X-interacting protein 1 isoform X3 n=1 Tax=Brienomyrus brachyistius TaxID=42636 RepID=UPI0020B35A25|nr:translin-associated factor X-interacting protein 1 isoform X3 [Brienomyrus brachyistius]